MAGTPLLDRVKRYFQTVFNKNGIYYLIEHDDWSVKWDGTYIAQAIKDLYRVNINVSTQYCGTRNSILHFGSRYIYLPSNWKDIHISNKIVLSWFHNLEKAASAQTQAVMAALLEALGRIDFIHTSCTVTKDGLISLGINPNKIIVIPLGVDTSWFKPLIDAQEKKKLRQEIGIPEGKICIGSFQKDGNGWGEGNEPKLVKGPDIFCDAVAALSKNYPLHILLTGPARGYVKNRLASAKIPFTHVYLQNYLDIVKYYKALDFHLVTSRAEGGPKAILESMATGVPVVSTKVGMANDIVSHGENGLLADVENTGQIVNCSSRLIEDRCLYQKVVKNGLETIKSYDWKVVAKEYYEKLYQPLL